MAQVDVRLQRIAALSGLINAHHKQKLQQTHHTTSPVICKYFQQGRCMNASCPFSHSTPSKVSPSSISRPPAALARSKSWTQPTQGDERKIFLICSLAISSNLF
eukprot:TRINITY_DN106_c0_g2_i3.p1 TRINITY_DN106_c0_g2~~TRINITY_DN106_c0_g2_i3.p1  ORF type:complete len:104 (-),score=2.00 TRINITY_DN106_c0_g2_i3:523-834(-)